jgi:hypothetical protein
MGSDEEGGEKVLKRWLGSEGGERKGWVVLR